MKYLNRIAASGCGLGAAVCELGINEMEVLGEVGRRDAVRTTGQTPTSEHGTSEVDGVHSRYAMFY